VCALRRPTRHVEENSDAHGDQHLSTPAAVEAEWDGAALLIAAILAQAVQDMRSRRPQVRAAAAQCWGDAQALQFWSDLGGCDVTRFPHALPG
jgi:hypothetical protein